MTIGERHQLRLDQYKGADNANMIISCDFDIKL